jgi:hypothetical protein
MRDFQGQTSAQVQSPSYCSFLLPADGGARDGGEAASSRKATTTYPTNTILAATTAEMAARVVEPVLVSQTPYTLHHFVRTS